VTYNHETPGAIGALPPLSIQPEVYTADQAAKQDMQAVSAVSQYQLGNAPTKRTPTAEVQQIASTGGARALSDQQDFERLCAEVASDCIAWLKQYADRTRQLPIYPGGAKVPLWRDFSKEDIQAEWEIEVAAHSTAPPNDNDRLQAVAWVTQSLAPILQLIPVAQPLGINLFPLIREVLNSLPDIQDADEIIEKMQGAQPSVTGPPVPMGGVSPLTAAVSPDALLAALNGQ
jgi:hypothetical protein